MPERKTLICVPASFEGYVTPGSLQAKCSKCGQSVRVSPSSWLIMHDNPGMEIVCAPCGIAQMKEDGEFEVEAIIPAQAEEIKEWLEKEERK